MSGKKVGKSGKKIGILGGTFDPVHRVHIRMAKQALRQFGLEEVWLMPSGNPPHKADKRIAPEQDRLHMVELAVLGETGLSASNYELIRPGMTYTADTLLRLHETYPETEWYFILGGDSLLYLDQWREPERIFSLAVILAAIRGSEEPEELLRKREELFSRFPKAKIEFLRMEGDPLSSTQIRNAFRSGDKRFLRQVLPESVYQYAENRRLYHGTEGSNPG